MQWLDFFIFITVKPLILAALNFRGSVNYIILAPLILCFACWTK